VIGSRLGPYEITAKLGEGGMGEVYRARDSKLEREVAIKVLPAAFSEDPERLARFEREARLLAQLHHPHVASVFGLEESEGVSALVMELVEGPTLAGRLTRGPLPLQEALAGVRPDSRARLPRGPRLSPLVTEPTRAQGSRSTAVRASRRPQLRSR
jgi:serine/threonine protein kinase